MTCDEKNEDRILAYLEGDLPEDVQSRLEEHLNSCAACRSYLEVQERLDAEVQEFLAGTELPAAFSSRVLEAVAAEREPLLPPERILQRKQELEADYASGLRNLRRAPRHRAPLHSPGTGATAGIFMVVGFLGLTLFWLFATDWVPALPAATAVLGDHRVLLSLGVASVFVGSGFRWAYRDLRHALREI